MASAHFVFSNSRSITHLANYLSQNLPMNSSDESDFSLDYLPPYSPDLNPIERVWKLTRRLCLHNRYFNHLEAVIDSVEAEFCSWTNHNETLRKLCAIT